ncbi:hypothetical protein ACOMHN_051455 [Nucella lapillus]
MQPVYFLPKKGNQCRHSLACHTASYCSATVESEAKPLVAHETQEHLSLGDDGQTLTVGWKDGTKSRFDCIWLRHNCHCGLCRQHLTSQRLIDPAELSHQIAISDVRMTGTDLEIRWQGEEEHMGKIPQDYLQQNCYEAHSLQGKRQAVSLETPVKTLPQIDYSNLISSETVVLR